MSMELKILKKMQDLLSKNKFPKSIIKQYNLNPKDIKEITLLFDECELNFGFLIDNAYDGLDLYRDTFKVILDILIEYENNFFDDIFKDTKYTKKELKIIFDTFLKEQIAL